MMETEEPNYKARMMGTPQERPEVPRDSMPEVPRDGMPEVPRDGLPEVPRVR